jgi:hypothetical protein
MSTPLANQNLQAALDSLTQRYREACLDPRPSYSVEGQSVSYESYLSMLATNIEKTQKMLNTGVIVEASTPIGGL